MLAFGKNHPHVHVSLRVIHDQRLSSADSAHVNPLVFSN
jgi:hypothetical protein